MNNEQPKLELKRAHITMTTLKFKNEFKLWKIERKRKKKTKHKLKMTFSKSLKLSLEFVQQPPQQKRKSD